MPQRNTQPTEQISYSDALQLIRNFFYQNVFGGGQTITPEQMTGANIDYLRSPSSQQFEQQLQTMDPDQVRAQAIQLAAQLPPTQRRAYGLNDAPPPPPTPVVHSAPPPEVANPDVAVTTPEAQPTQVVSSAYKDIMAYDQSNPISTDPGQALQDIRDRRDAHQAIWDSYYEQIAPNDILGTQTHYFIEQQKLDLQNIDNQAALIQKYGPLTTEQAITASIARMNASANMQNAVTNAAQLGLETRKLDQYYIPQLMNQLFETQALKLPAEKMNELSTVFSSAFSLAVEQQKEQWAQVGMLENVGEFEQNRQDKAVAALASLQQGLSEMLSSNARSIASAAIQAGGQFLDMLPSLITDQNRDQYLPGSEPGGAFNYMANLAGYNFTPTTYGMTERTRAFDPFAPVNELRNNLAAAEAQYPRPDLSTFAPPYQSPALSAMDNYGIDSSNLSPLLQSMTDIAGGQNPWAPNYGE